MANSILSNPQVFASKAESAAESVKVHKRYEVNLKDLVDEYNYKLTYPKKN